LGTDNYYSILQLE